MVGLTSCRVALLSLFSLLALAGCRDPEKERALADAKASKTALAEVKSQLDSVKATLETTQKDRDGLKANVTDLSGSIENLKKQLSEITQVRDKLQAAADQVTALKAQLTQLGQDKDAAVAKATDALAMVEKLKGQLQEQMQKVAGLLEQNGKLQQTIDELKKLVGAPKLP